jgi:hypothetical protein
MVPPGVWIGLLTLGASAKPPAATTPLTRICVTEHAYNSSEADFRRRFADYQALGVDTIRLATGWLDHPALISALKPTALRIKMILYVLGIPPDYAAAHPSDRMIDEHGVADWHFGPWSPGRAATTLATGRAELAKLAASGLADRVDEVVVDAGPAGEGIYPANWTVHDRRGEEAYWCYSADAQASFREAMRAKYTSIEAANAAWHLVGDQRCGSWERLEIPAPRTAWARGPFWIDLLRWYRDAKRRMIVERIEQTQALARQYLGARARCIVYLPGWAYTQADWDQAAREASGPGSIRLMMDNDWLMTTAVERGCVLQYTGVENAAEVRNIVRKLKAAGSTAYQTMWGENAGYEVAGRNPIWLARVITAYGLRGVDFTWSNWLYEKDGLTRSRTFAPFAYATRLIRTFYDTGESLPPYQPETAARQTGPGRWTLRCVAATRLMGGFPDAIKGDDPEIAALQGPQTQRLLLRFPLELLPQGAVMARARLVLKRYRDWGDDRAAAPLAVYRLTEPWNSVSATWTEAAEGHPWSRPGGAAADRDGRPYDPAAALRPWALTQVGPFGQIGEAVEWDVTDLCRAQAAGPNHGLMVVLDGQATGDKSFASPAHPDPAMAPVLEVEVGAGA